MRVISILVIVAILGTSFIGVGEMTSYQGNGNSNWYQNFWNFFDIKKFTGFLNSGGSGGSNNNQDDDDDDDDNGDDDGDQSPIDSASIGFGVGIRVIEDNGDTTFQNTIDECVFHSAESFDPLCIKCKFLDAYGKVVAKGEEIKLDEEYTASDRVPIEMHSVPEASPGDPVSNDIKNVKNVKLQICGFDCKCIKPTKFTVRYDGPKDGVTVKIFKKIKNGAPNEFVFQVPGTFNSGSNITIDSQDWGQNTVNPDTVYAFYKYGKLIGYVKIHTSCSQPLFIGDMFFFKQGDLSKQIKLTVVSGFDKNNNPAIPPSSCKKEEPGFFVGGGKVYVPKNGGGTYTLTHGFELHCDTTLGPNNLEINWLKNKFHLEELEEATCIDDGSPNEPPPSPHPGPTLDVYTGSGYGRYNGVCGAFATWSMDDNGEPGKKDQILSLKIKKSNEVVLDIGMPFNNPLSLQTGNHQWVPHPSTHPNPPTQTTPCPEITP